MAKIVVLDGETLNPGDNPWTELQGLGDVQIFQQSVGTEIVARAGQAEILVVNKIPLTADVLQQLPQLKLVAVTATGYDCVDVAAARSRQITVCNVPIYGTESVAQHVFALLLHVIHRVDVHDTAIRAGEWQACGNFSFWRSPLTELCGKTMGIIGFGRIGSSVARLAHAFGMEVCATTRTPKQEPSWVKWATVDSVLSDSDVVSLHCPLTPETTSLIDGAALARMKSSAILLNASRGPLIDETALAHVLNEGGIAAAGLDVLSMEPPRTDHPLLTARNCFLTPHMAWATLEARRRLMAVTVENVRQFLDGEPQHVVS